MQREQSALEGPHWRMPGSTCCAAHDEPSSLISNDCSISAVVSSSAVFRTAEPALRRVWRGPRGPKMDVRRERGDLVLERAPGQYNRRAMSFDPPTAPPWLISGFVFLPMLVMLLAQWGLSLAARRAGSPRWFYWLCAAGLLAAMAFSLMVAARGSLAQFQRVPPPFLPLTFGCVVLWVLIATSRLSSGFQQLPLVALVGFQSFRLPLELMMHAAADAGVMPPQMSYSGYNFDVVSGATAAVVALLLALGKAPRWLLLGWSALSTALLAVILLVAILSAPPLMLFGREQANTWIAYAPFVWLPTVLVPAAVSGHVLLWRRLLLPETRSPQAAVPADGAAPKAAAIDSRA